MKIPIRVKVFKQSGKYFAIQESENLSEAHAKLTGWDIEQLIKDNDPSVVSYSPLASGFGGHYYYSIEVLYPKGSGNFCTFLYDGTR